MNKAVLFSQKNKPLVSIILPIYNEATILESNIETIYNRVIKDNTAYSWEIIIVNDGSKDDSGKIAEKLAIKYPIIKVVHHLVNLNLGNSLKTGFEKSSGKYVITLDVDLSYSEDHIIKLLNTIEVTQADVVLASPYMKGGKVTDVPFARKIMSKCINWLMSISAQEKFHTYTCMVRAYKGEFIKNLNLKTKDYEINPEILYKAMILRAKIVEIPAHLDWTLQNKIGKKRISGLKINKGIKSGLMASFIFRPQRYFFTFGFIMFIVFIYILAWVFINIGSIYDSIDNSSYYFDDRFSKALAIVFNDRPYAFIIGGFVLVVAIQFFSIAFLSFQKKRYYEELFHLSSSIKKQLNNNVLI